jgi:hypothetical protein
MVSKVRVDIGPYTFTGRLEDDLAPETCKVFRSMLPLKQKVIHVRWSGEGVWIPLGDARYEIPYENATSHPPPGQFIFYPGGVSEAEILLAYSGVDFSSKAGQLAGNPFLTLTDNLDKLMDLGRLVLWSGAQDITISAQD